LTLIEAESGVEALARVHRLKFKARLCERFRRSNPRHLPEIRNS